MTPGGRRVAVLFAVGFGGVVAWLAWEGRQTAAFVQSQTLPDGSVVELRAVTFGKTHRCFYGAFWQRFLRHIMPQRLAGNIGGAEMVHDTKDNCLVFWIVHKRVQENFFWDRTTLAVEVSDRGQEGEFGDWAANFRGKRDELSGVVLSAFDRRGKTIGLRLYRRAGGRWDRVAEFKVPNPAYGIFPTWKPEPLPITKSSGDLAVTLTEATVGALLPLSPVDWKREPTRLGFRLAQEGRATTSWALSPGISISDATGNQRDDWHFIRHEEKDGQTERLFPGVFTPQECWNLRVGVARTAAADFSPDELWVVGLPVAILDSPLHTNASTQLQGVTLQLVNRLGNEFRGAQEPILEVRLSPPRKDLNVTLIHVTTRPDQAVPSWSWSPDNAYGRGKFAFFHWNIPEGAKTLDLTFAVHQTRYFDFLVRPSVVETNRFLRHP